MPSVLRLSLLLVVLAPAALAAQAQADVRVDEVEGMTREGPGIHALVIGITDYPNIPKEQRPRYAEQDAELFHIALQKSPLAPSLRNVTILPNSAARRRDILEAVRTIGAEAGPDDLLYIFFSGYGILDSLNRGFIMPFDADPAFPEHNGIRVEHFVEQIATSTQARNIVLLVDASHEGSITRPVLDAFNRYFGRRDGNYVALLSAGDGQRSFEDPNFEYGLFTWYLAEALEGSADRAQSGNQDGFVTMRELYRHIVDRVEDRADQAFGAIQTPIISPDYDPLFLPVDFGIIGDLPPRLQPEDIERHLERAGRLEQAQDYHGAGQAYTRVLEIDPDHEQARDRLGFILQDHLFEYERARTVISYWVDRRDAGGEKLVSYAQTLLTTERFEQHEAFVAGLLANDEFNQRLEVVLRALQIANFVALEMHERAFSSLASLVAELSSRSRSFAIDWSFRGTIHFIEENDTFGTHQAWLVEFFDALETETDSDLINRIRSMR